MWAARARIVEERHPTEKQQTKKQQKQHGISRSDATSGVALFALGVGEGALHGGVQNFTSREILDELEKRRGHKILDELPSLHPMVATSMAKNEAATVIVEERECGSDDKEDESQMYGCFGREDEFDKEEEMIDTLRSDKKWLVTKEQRLADAVIVAFSAHRRKQKAKWEEKKKEGISQDIDPLTLAERTLQSNNAVANSSTFSESDMDYGPSNMNKTHAVDQQYLGLTAEQYRAHQRPSSRARQRRLNQVRECRFDDAPFLYPNLGAETSYLPLYQKLLGWWPWDRSVQETCSPTSIRNDRSKASDLHG